MVNNFIGESNKNDLERYNYRFKYIEDLYIKKKVLVIFLRFI